MFSLFSLQEQLKQASFKGDVQSSSSVACSSLAIMEPGADDQEDKDQDAQTRTTAHNFAIVLHSSTASASPSGFSANAALVASLDESVINSSDDAPLLAITNNDHSSSTGITSESSAPQSLGHFIKVSTVKVDDRAMNAESTAPRPNTVPVNSPERRKLLELSNEPHSDRPQDQLDDAETPHLQARRRNTALTFPSANMLQESSETIPDLSQTTLDVSDYTHSGGDEAPPDSARSVASPSHPLVAKLLMHNNSELLYVKDGCFCSRLGPDELPGLRAWKLVSIFLFSILF